MRALLVIAGVALAATGGVIAYRAAFVAPHAAVIINEASGHAREVRDVWSIAVGLILLCAGAALAFLAARRRA